MCKNSLVDKLLKELENQSYNETLNRTSSNDLLRDCVSCTSCTVLFAVLLITSVIIGSVFLCFYWRLKKRWCSY